MVTVVDTIRVEVTAGRGEGAVRSVRVTESYIVDMESVEPGSERVEEALDADIMVLLEQIDRADLGAGHVPNDHVGSRTAIRRDIGGGVRRSAPCRDAENNRGSCQCDDRSSHSDLRSLVDGSRTVQPPSCG